MRFSGCPNLPLNLRGNRAVGNLVVFCQQHGFGEDDRERVVALKRDKQLVGCVFFAAVGYDAEVLVVWQHQDVAAADVDFVGTQLALYDEEVAVYVGNLGDFQARQQGFQYGFAGFGHFAQIAEGIALPVAVKRASPPLSSQVGSLPTLATPTNKSTSRNTSENTRGGISIKSSAVAW